MMRVSRLALTGVAVLAVGALSAPAFAAGVTPSPSPSPSPSRPTLTIDYVSAPTITHIPGFTQYQFTIKVSGLTVTSGVDYAQFNYNVPASSPLGSGSLASQSMVTKSGTKTFTVAFDVSSGEALNNIDVTEFQQVGNSYKAIDQSNIVSLTGKLPYGQLPEVPWTVGLPIIGLGAGAWLWRRRAVGR